MDLDQGCREPRACKVLSQPAGRQGAWKPLGNSKSQHVEPEVKGFEVGELPLDGLSAQGG